MADVCQKTLADSSSPSFMGKVILGRPSFVKILINLHFSDMTRVSAVFIRISWNDLCHPGPVLMPKTQFHQAIMRVPLMVK